MLATMTMAMTRAERNNEEREDIVVMIMTHRGVMIGVRIMTCLVQTTVDSDYPRVRVEREEDRRERKVRQNWRRDVERPRWRCQLVGCFVLMCEERK